MTTGTVFDVQTYAVHDGPGIRTVVFLKGCPLRCAWCCNPESQRLKPDLRHHGLRCRSCGICATSCQRGAIGKGPTFDRAACETCEERECVDTCPERALAWAGQTRDADEVVKMVARDERFFVNSGGGVTFSGGEPFFQPRFLQTLLTASRKRGLHVAVETCGHAAQDVIQACADDIDLFLFDIKIVDAQQHVRATGRHNALILSNLSWLASHHRDHVVVRVPLIPGQTDSVSNLDAIGGLVRSLNLHHIELQPYHPFGTEKYGSLGRSSPMSVDACLQTEEDVVSALEVLKQSGAACEVV